MAQEQNYCSVKLWGAEGGGKMGRIVLVCEGKEVGQRHGAGQDIFIDSVDAVSPGAFWYRTTLLPKWLTEGKTSVEIRLRSTGSGRPKAPCARGPRRFARGFLRHALRRFPHGHELLRDQPAEFRPAGFASGSDLVSGEKNSPRP